jgi:excisionase family DNA binding protein
MQPVEKPMREPQSPTFERLLNLQEAASILGMHWKTLEGMARNRKVPALKVGKRWRFRLSSLNTWLEKELNSTTTDHAALTGQEQNP